MERKNKFNSENERLEWLLREKFVVKNLRGANEKRTAENVEV